MGPRRGSRYVPEDFELSPVLQAFAKSRGLSSQQIAKEWDKFKDCEFPKAHVDWERAWRNWCRRVEGRVMPVAVKTAVPDAAETKRLLTKILGDGKASFLKEVPDDEGPDAA